MAGAYHSLSGCLFRLKSGQSKAFVRLLSKLEAVECAKLEAAHVIYLVIYHSSTHKPSYTREPPYVHSFLNFCIIRKIVISWSSSSRAT